MPRIKFPGLHKAEKTEEASPRSERGVSFGNESGMSTKAEDSVPRTGVKTMTNIMGVRKNPSTIFKPPFGTNAEEHHSRLGEHTKHLWRYNKITDLTVKLEGIQYPCHKTVLSCYSKYFKELLLEQKGTVNMIHLKLPSVSPDAFEVLLSYMYTSQLNLTCQNIGEVYTAARKLGTDGALVLCTRILTGKSKYNVHSVYVYVTAKKERLYECAVKALKIMTKRFEQIVGTPEFLDLDYSQVMEYLSQDVLATRSEVIVYLAALKWLSVKYLEREEYAADLIGCVRFQMMTLNEILACFSPPLLPGILQKKVISDKLLAATCYVAAVTVNEERRFGRFACKPRRYLLKREPLILWDPSIFDEERHAMYMEEIAATTIQAAFRGYKTRKSIEADREAGLLEQPETELEDFEPPKDDDDETYIPGAERPFGSSFLENIRKSIISFMSSTDEGEKKSTENESRSSDKSDEEQKNDKNEKSHSEEDESLSTENAHSLRRSSSIDTLADRVSTLAEKTELKKYTSDTLVNSTEAFKQTHQKPETIHKVFANLTNEEDLKKFFDQKSDITSEETMETSENSNGYLLVTGGFRSDTEKHSTEGKDMFLYSVANNEWKKYGTMDNARHHHCLVLLNEAVYSIGGCNPKKIKAGRMVPDKACFKFNLEFGKWSNISKMKHSRMYHGVAELGGRIYVIGGKDAKDRLLNSVEVYNRESNTWEVSDIALDVPTLGIGVCVHKGEIWTVGGMVQADDGTVRLLDSVRSLDPEKMSWDSNHGQLPTPRAFSTVVSFEDDLYAIGGTSRAEGAKEEELESVSDVFYYNDKEKRWVPTADLPFPRHFVKASVTENHLYILGGLTTFQTTAVDQLLMFEKKTQTWQTCTPFPEPLCGVASVFIPNAPQKYSQMFNLEDS